MGMTLAEYMAARTKPEPSTGCWLWIGALHAGGYGVVCINSRRYLAHRVAWEMAHGHVPNNLCVCHRCDTPPCVNPAHLFLGTHSDNHADMWRKGRGKTHIAFGTANGNHRLTPALVRAIRATYVPHEHGLLKTARLFGVAKRTVWLIVNNRTWRHVSNTKDES